MGNMIRCHCGTYHYRNDPCPDDDTVEMFLDTCTACIQREVRLAVKGCKVGGFIAGRIVKGKCNRCTYDERKDQRK